MGLKCASLGAANGRKRVLFKIAIGFDPRQAVSYNVCQFSLIRRASEPISITPLVIDTLPIERKGLTPFTFTRFLIPHLFSYKGWVLWMDSDIIAQDDPIRIWDYANPNKAVIVAEGVKPFERAAVMLFNCSHPDNRVLTPEFVEKAEGLHSISWTKEYGFFPRRWNHCIGYCPETDDLGLIHYTQGVPAFPQTGDCEHADKWREELKLLHSTQDWVTLMGGSVHAVMGPDGLEPRYRSERCHLQTTRT